MNDTTITGGTSPFVVANVSVGFLRLVPGTIQVIGSGTLVRVENLHGIITARHVWEKVEKLGEVEIYQYPSRRREIQSLRVPINLLDALCCGSAATEDELGPDLAFIKVPGSVVASIEKHSFFLNLEKSRHTLSNPPVKGVWPAPGFVDTHLS